MKHNRWKTEVSIIIPVYNTERYLSKCIESVLTQDFTDYEMILVNDASPDNSRSIIERYARKDTRIRIIDKKENQGLEAARFSGYEIAEGDYIMHIDSDDWIERHILARMHRKAEETGADIIFDGGYNRVQDRFGIMKGTRTENIHGLICNPELFDKYYAAFFGAYTLNVSVWGKLYRRATIEKAGIVKCGISYKEDSYYNLMLFPFVSSIYILDGIGYNWRAGGMTTRLRSTFMSDTQKLFEVRKSLIEKYNYHKAEDPMYNETIFNMEEYILDKIRWSKQDKSSLTADIAAILNTPCFRDVKAYYLQKGNISVFQTALVAGDIPAMVSIQEYKAAKTRNKELLKRIYRRILG
ncbi:MAG: glycosyltransferase family 2 protein [Dysgonamonadaceae bacterium]|jgi:glycosyltransferase involved in cell wall biosynthesis|nr:glycosyltransferase family 2 protein [Dysgonamonadaceae bacterium]